MLVDRPGPARPMNVLEDGPRAGPAHQIFKNRRPGPARLIISLKVPARPGPSHGSEAHETRDLMGRPDNCVGWPVDLTGRPMGCPILKGACAYADVIFFRLVVFSLFFSGLHSVGQLLSAHETRHQYSTHYSHNPSSPTSRSDGFLWTTTSCCCNARSSSSNSSGTCCCNTRCCCNTLYRA